MMWLEYVTGPAVLLAIQPSKTERKGQVKRLDCERNLGPSTKCTLLASILLSCTGILVRKTAKKKSPCLFVVYSVDLIVAHFPPTHPLKSNGKREKDSIATIVRCCFAALYGGRNNSKHTNKAVQHVSTMMPSLYFVPCPIYDDFRLSW